MPSRYRGYKKPRKAQRLRRRHAKWWDGLSPEAREMYTYLIDEMRADLKAELDRQILYGEGSDIEPVGIVQDEERINAVN